MPLLVGLTGNIASGKSTVAAMLAAHGAVVVDADALAREAVTPGTEALATIAGRWPQVISSDGSLDREALGRIVFANDDERAALERIVHPQVDRLRRARVAAAAAAGARLVVYDVPLLFEAGLADQVDVVVVVDAPAALRRDRLLRDRGLAARDADAMLAAQMPAQAKRVRADHVIENDGDLERLRTQVDALWAALAKPATRE